MVNGQWVTGKTPQELVNKALTYQPAEKQGQTVKEYIENFNIDEEIMLWWGETTSTEREKRGLPFDNIREHYDDLKCWLKNLQKVCNKMPY